ncbi:hypothetical protein [uncultured Xylophilus sp.]|uniref:hypothetical protein n=1 Tax=uncultured Xylophilus sp. TaxID=296832 RepID=UPI0025D63DAA|nr:hypothetical protein [uncultured Xylophilus sp.]
MHAAPSVRFPVVRSRRAAVLWAAAWILGAASVGYWSVAVPDVPASIRVIALLWVLATGAMAWHAWYRSPQGTLGWDGQHWHWEPAERGASETPPGRIALCRDLQGLMLLRFEPAAGRGRWLWTDHASSPQHWHALRCAVHATARTAAPTAGLSAP